jgi:quercetin dioxygenase-like cupin family protein
MSKFTDYRDHIGAQADKPFKSTLFRSGRLMLGLNCLSPGQEQHLHDHAEQDKFYFVVEGTGRFVVGDETQSAGPGTAVWAPAGVPHGVRNDTNERLVVLIGIAPFAGR